MSRRMRVGITTLFVVFALWLVLTTWTGIISPGRFPSPDDTWQALIQLWSPGYANGTLTQHVGRSLLLIVAGFAAAGLIGVPLGLWMGWSRKAEAVINPVFLLIRPIPPLAWIPLAILWLGLGDAAKILVIWFAAFVPCVINAYTGIRTVDKTLIEAARMLDTPPIRMTFEVLLPAASPMIFTGLRLSLQAAWTTLVAAELVGALYGLGRVLNVAQQDLYPGMILIGMLAVSIGGWATTYLLARFERKSLQWNQAATAAG